MGRGCSRIGTWVCLGVSLCVHVASASIPGRLDSRSCLDLLVGPRARGGGLHPQDPSEEKNVFLRAKAIGKFGSKVFLLHSPSGEWVSRYRTFRNAPQGDPRWMIRLLGESAAAFFGFRMLSAEDDGEPKWMTIPSVEELNAAIRFFNDHRDPAIEAIPLSFYNIPGKNLASPEEYVRRFGLAFELPMAQFGTTLIHDCAFHAPILALVVSLLRLPQEQTSEAVRFIDWLAADAESDPQSQNRREILTGKIYLDKVADIDFGTGNFTIGLLEHLDVPMAFMGLEKLTRAFDPPEVALRSLILRLRVRDEIRNWGLRQYEKFLALGGGRSSTVSPASREIVCSDFVSRIEQIRHAVDGFASFLPVEPTFDIDALAP